MTSSAAIDKYLSSTIGDCPKLALFLDYDGTLSPICPHPDLAIIPENTKHLLEKLSNCENIYTAIISGRQADDAKKMVGIDNIVYAGSHGFEIIYPKGTRYQYETPAKDKENIQNIVKGLNKEVVRDGAWVESKGDVLTFHYRDTPEELRPELINKAKEIIRSFGLEPTSAIYGLEVQPEIDWNKGHAAKLLLENKYGKDWNKQVKMIYMGDDTTDERLMEMFKGNATTFRIAASENVKTAAGLRLSTLEEVIYVLNWVKNRFCHAA